MTCNTCAILVTISGIRCQDMMVMFGHRCGCSCHEKERKV